jgi:phosphoribosyl-ATP pyrophosphohydrolase
VICQRLKERPEGSYVAQLSAGGLDLLAKKVGEEATEVVIATKNGDPDELTREMADLWFHCYVLLAQSGIRPEDVWAELAKRRK